MKIHIKELGAIKEGIIDLSNKLNVFCGPNGTGKTYMAFIIYALTQNEIHVGYTDEKIINELIEKKKIIIPINFKEIFKYKADLVENIASDFDSIYGISPELSETYFKETKIAFDDDEDVIKSSLINSSFDLSFKIGSIFINFTKEKGLDSLIIEIKDKTISNKDIEPLRFLLKSKILSFLSNYPIISSSIFPVERNSIYTFSKELSLSRNDAIDHLHAVTNNKNISKFDLFFRRTTRYPMPIRDGLIIAEDLANIKKTKSEYFLFAEQMEDELLNGKVIITNDGEIQFKSNKAPKKQLPIHLTASIVKTLSSLVVYLKHIANKNDLIIIDEPEINLHPDNQIILTRLFARLINNGFRLLISTHSDYIIREINNLIMLSSKNKSVKELSKKFNYKEDEIINHQDLGVYYFNYPSRKTLNKQVEIENLIVTEVGFEIPSIDKAIEEQNSIAEELFYMIKYDDLNEQA